MLGIGMGIGLGFMQWLILRKWIADALNWIWFLVLGLTIPFLLFELFKKDNEFFLILIVLIGGFLSTYLQYQFLLKKNSAQAKKWIVYGFLSWLAVDLLFLILMIPGLFHVPLDTTLKLVNLATLIICAPLMGYITGKGLSIILKQENKIVD
jgi:Na+/H+ antiporter NhaA